MKPQSFTSGDAFVVVNDSYNANPESTCSLFEIVEDLVGAGKRVGIVLGEIRELGTFSEKFHEEVGAAASESGASFVLFPGRSGGLV
jgi:UDP-N-acetylmuramoyl-tripeptide--D-alanyl-D-alanine ligase